VSARRLFHVRGRLAHIWHTVVKGWERTVKGDVLLGQGYILVVLEGGGGGCQSMKDRPQMAGIRTKAVFEVWKSF
jgi:hypothetical protein